MNLFDKYVIEVGKRLPRKTRSDIQAEIRSTLQDMLEDRSQQTGRPADDVLMLEVLKDFGAPAKVAVSYGATQYLIGPRLYPFFEMVVKIVFAVLLAVSLFGLGFNLFQGGLGGAELAEALMQFGMQLVGGLVAAFGNIVIVFAILERTLPSGEFEDKNGEWSPAELAREPDPDDVKVFDQVMTIVFTTILLIVINLYTDRIGLYFFNESDSIVFIPFLTEAFFRYVPWINLMALVEIALGIYLLRHGSWQPATRLVSLALNLAAIVLVIAMWVGPTIITLSPEALAGTPLAGNTELQQLLSQLSFVPFVLVMLIVNGIEAGQTVWGMINRPSLPQVQA